MVKNKVMVGALVALLAILAVVTATQFGGGNLKGALTVSSDITVGIADGSSPMIQEAGTAANTRTSLVVKLSKAYPAPVTAIVHLKGTAKANTTFLDYTIGHVFWDDGTGGAYLDVVLPTGVINSEVNIQSVDDSTYEGVETVSAKVESAYYLVGGKMVTLSAGPLSAFIKIDDREDALPTVKNVFPAKNAVIYTDSDTVFKVLRSNISGWIFQSTQLCFTSTTVPLYCILATTTSTDSFTVTSADLVNYISKFSDDRRTYPVKWFVQSYYKNPYDTAPNSAGVNFESEKWNFTLSR